MKTILEINDLLLVDTLILFENKNVYTKNHKMLLRVIFLTPCSDSTREILLCAAKELPGGNKRFFEIPNNDISKNTDIKNLGNITDEEFKENYPEWYLVTM